MKGGARSKAIPGRSIDYIKALRFRGSIGDSTKVHLWWVEPRKENWHRLRLAEKGMQKPDYSRTYR